MRLKPFRLLLICLLILGFFLGAYEEIWKQGAKKVTNNNVQLNPSKVGVYLEVIWDASGSMWGRDSGIEKIIKSKEVLKTFSKEIPENVNLGLRIFGARRVADIKDSFLAIPLHSENREAIINFVTNVKPLGKSPIGYSIQEAGKDLQKVNGKRYIILISDGIENGEIPTADIVDELIAANIVLHIVQIGEPENQELKEKLKELAEKTGGKYFTYDQYQKVIPTFSQ